jgi:hypothetical protein
MLAHNDIVGRYAIIPAPATPDADRRDAVNTVDLTETERVVNALIFDGVNGLIVLGTTGECGDAHLRRVPRVRRLRSVDRRQTDSGFRGDECAWNPREAADRSQGLLQDRTDPSALPNHSGGVRECGAGVRWAKLRAKYAPAIAA